MTREKAIKIIKEFINSTCLHVVDQEALETLIPELCESEDEMIRREIMEFVSWAASRGSVRNDWFQQKCPEKWLAWLEKQKSAEVDESTKRLNDDWMKQYFDEAEKFSDSAESYHQGFITGQKKMKEDIEKGFGISEHSLDYLAGRYAGYTAAMEEQKSADFDGKAMLHVSNKSYQIGFRDGVNSTMDHFKMVSDNIKDKEYIHTNPEDSIK